MLSWLLPMETAVAASRAASARSRLVRAWLIITGRTDCMDCNVARWLSHKCLVACKQYSRYTKLASKVSVHCAPKAVGWCLASIRCFVTSAGKPSLLFEHCLLPVYVLRSKQTLEQHVMSLQLTCTIPCLLMLCNGPAVHLPVVAATKTPLLS